jgi:hypothetical protein
MAVSLGDSFMLAKEVLPAMNEKRNGAVILTASILSHVAISGFAAYCTAKGGLLQLMRSPGSGLQQLWHTRERCVSGPDPHAGDSCRTAQRVFRPSHQLHHTQKMGDTTGGGRALRHVLSLRRGLVCDRHVPARRWCLACNVMRFS